MKSKFVFFTNISLAIGIILVTQGSCGSKPTSSKALEEVAASPPHQEQQRERSEDMLRFTDSQIKEFGITTESAAAGTLRIDVVLPGEVVLNADRVAHVVPRVSGVVREVRKNLGDSVRRGEVMAVMESRELADSTAALLAARQRVSLAQSSYEREDQAWRKKVSPEQDYIEAKNKLAEANIELHTAEQKLRALGFSNEYIAQLPGRKDDGTILYQIAAPFKGTVIEKHINIGEVLKDDSPAFLVADLSVVWVNLDVQQKDLPLVRVGQTASIGTGNEASNIVGHIQFLDPIATETNRTIHARIVVPNEDGRLRPGLFVTGRILAQSIRVPMLIPNDALVMVDGKMCLFVKFRDAFRSQPVTAGRTDGRYTEILQGLSPGQRYVAKGAFTLKSEMEKPEAE
jgi:membrane fusion protein, heavy metal efflux system